MTLLLDTIRELDAIAASQAKRYHTPALRVVRTRDTKTVLYTRVTTEDDITRHAHPVTAADTTTKTYMRTTYTCTPRKFYSEAQIEDYRRRLQEITNTTITAGMLIEEILPRITRGHCVDIPARIDVTDDLEHTPLYETND